MTGEVCVGVPPTPGDEALINRVSAPNATGARWLTVRRVRPCADPRWAWLSGIWSDRWVPADPVMVWLDHLLVRKASRSGS